MNTKHFFKITAIALLFSFSKLIAQTVYVTETGKKYHERNCKVAKTGKKGIELAEAKKLGLDACNACFNGDKKEKPKPKKVIKK